MPRWHSAAWAVAAAGAAAPVRLVAAEWTFTKAGHDPSAPAALTVQGVGAGPFDPSKMANFLRDVRAPLLAPDPGGSCPGNIYAANAVDNGGAVNVYFGGWDGVSSCHDSVSVAVTDDDFATFNPHATVIATGAEMHVNNPSVLKRPDNAVWAALYTQLPTSGPPLNKPGFSTSVDGVNWEPAAGGATQLVQMAGYDGWDDADVNGGNVIVFANDGSEPKYHMYFVDFKKESQFSVSHATATAPSGTTGGAKGEAGPLAFTYEGVALADPMRVPTDVKLVNGHWLLGCHMNGQQTYYSVVPAPAPGRSVHTKSDGRSDNVTRAIGPGRLGGSRNGGGGGDANSSAGAVPSSSSGTAPTPPDAWPSTSVLFTHTDAADNYIVSVGFVVDEAATVLRGVLYGAGAVPQLDNNRVFATWLQRRVIFRSSDNTTVWGIGNAAQSKGPGAVQLDTNAPMLTGSFYLHDADYVDEQHPGSLLAVSAEVTVAPGDVWTVAEQ